MDMSSCDTLVDCENFKCEYEKSPSPWKPVSD